LAEPETDLRKAWGMDRGPTASGPIQLAVPSSKSNERNYVQQWAQPRARARAYLWEWQQTTAQAFSSTAEPSDQQR